jgi:hypothetical protein
VFVYFHNCCYIAVTQINYPNLNKQDNIKQANGKHQSKVPANI